MVGTKGTNLSRDYRTNVRIPPNDSGLDMETVFLCFQVRSLDVKRFPDEPAGRLSDESMNRVEDVVRYSLGL
ncbi:MAG: type II toxin-antitoxin system PemK/MazF family toxin [Anaerolineae bacterium]|nr:type II toxin-antitoxin system PemK/MazF family toxin [Anaerolineae bacterium]